MVNFKNREDMAPASLLNSKPYFKFKNTYPQDIGSKFKFKK